MDNEFVNSRDKQENGFQEKPIPSQHENEKEPVVADSEQPPLPEKALTDEEAKIQSLRDKIKVQSRRLRHSTTTNQMLVQWIALIQNGSFIIGPYLRYLGYRNIAIFSAPLKNNAVWNKRNAIETLLIQEINADPNIELKCIISDNERTLGGILSIVPSNLTSETEIDLIIVPLPQSLPEVKKTLGNRYKVLSLNEILAPLFEAYIKDLALIKTLVSLRNQGKWALMLGTPTTERITQPSEYESALAADDAIFDKEGYYHSCSFDEYYSFEEFESLLKARFSVVPYHDYWRQVDVQTKFVNYTNYERHTTDVPEHYDQIIHIFGDSSVLDYSVEDRFTAASTLQRLVNDEAKMAGAKSFRVINHSINAANTHILSNMINDSTIAEDDIVIVARRNNALNGLFSQLLKANDIRYYDTQPDFERPHDDGEVFRDKNHLNFRGSQKLGRVIFRVLEENRALSAHLGYRDGSVDTPEFDPLFSSWNSLQHEIPILEESAIDPITQSPEFFEFIKQLQDMRRTDVEDIGAIVMNCNPFTRGHQFLIETCAAKVDLLYIFVVEEDRSDFPFADRIKLVTAGTAHLPNVEVLPSGKFIISTLTFPEYFQKGDLQEVAIDPSNDVELFGRYIAPALGITQRFVGEEPLDKVTLQYNQAMQRLLPGFGIYFEVIPRIEKEGAPISASWVRRLLAAKDVETIATIVPQCTLDYLIEKYSMS